MLTRIFSYHQVMPNYLDLVSLFGAHSRSRDLDFGDFRWQVWLRNTPSWPALPALGRSGQPYQMCYTLRSVASISAATEVDVELQEWTRRQMAIHHQFDVVVGTMLWIITASNLEMKERVEKIDGSKW
jgi:hypothetical protein